jgi:type II secretory pathway pseudopilin PulG
MAMSKQDQRGISLMETMVVVGIMSIVMVVVSQVFVVNGRLMATTIARADSENSAVLAVRRIGDNARGAVAVEASATVNGTAYVSGEDSLVLRIPSMASDGTIIADTFDLVAFYRHGTLTEEIWTDTEAGAGSIRLTGQKKLSGHNLTLRFLYDDPAPAEAERVSVYIVNGQTVRDTELRTRSGTTIFLRNR